MVDQHAGPVRLYRWIVFLLAAGYVVYQFLIKGDYSVPGGPFRFLTFWALLLSFFCASRMLALSEGRSRRRWEALVGATAVANALVVLLYWRLYFIDPSLVNNGEPGPWHQEYYLHLVGPALQWIDALFILGAFRRFWPSFLVFLALVTVYPLFIEFVIAPLSDVPAGSVTNGLPYPFLNDMEPMARLAYYAQIVVTGTVFLLGFHGLAWAIRRLRGQAPA